MRRIVSVETEREKEREAEDVEDAGKRREDKRSE